jgi:phosphoribosyl-AMP cyclohydrolase
MADNGTHVVICTAKEAYYANNTAFGNLPEEGLFPTAQDGYIVYAQRGSQRLWISGLDDATTISGVDFTSTDADPDNIIAAIASNRQIYGFGAKTTEVLYNSGNPIFPFERTPSGVVERGCLAPHSVAKDRDSAYFLGDDSKVYRISGGGVQAISTHDVSRRVLSDAAPTGAVGFVSEFQGHTFYCLILSDSSWAFNVATQQWSELASPDIVGGGVMLSRWRPSCLVRAWDGVEYIGDFERPMIHKLSEDKHSELGTARRWEAVLSLGDGNWRTMDSIEIELETGNYSATDEGLGDPDIMLKWSDDGGKNWGTELTHTAYDLGNYGKQVTFNRLGRYRRRQVMIAGSAPFLAAIAGVRVRERGYSQ